MLTRLDLVTVIPAIVSTSCGTRTSCPPPASPNAPPYAPNTDAPMNWRNTQDKTQVGGDATAIACGAVTCNGFVSDVNPIQPCCGG
jgi:hypothetical protein